MSDINIHDQPVAVLHEDVPHLAQARLVAWALLEQPGIGVVTLNPERDALIKTAKENADKRPLAA